MMNRLYDLLIGWWYDMPLTNYEERRRAWKDLAK